MREKSLFIGGIMSKLFKLILIVMLLLTIGCDVMLIYILNSAKSTKPFENEYSNCSYSKTNTEGSKNKEILYNCDRYDVTIKMK